MQKVRKKVKKMYIPPFWCGVIATVLVELLATIIMAFAVRTKPEKGEKDDDCN
jgi:hypothetical protein